LEEKIFYDFAVLVFKKIETLDVPLITWKKYGGNKCKLVESFKIWSRFWINRDLVMLQIDPPIYAQPLLFFDTKLNLDIC